MINIIYLIVFLLLTANRDIKSQEINPLAFFPYHVGDLWQYINYTQSGNEFWEKKITAIDTVETDTSIIITVNYRNSFYLNSIEYGHLTFV